MRVSEAIRVCARLNAVGASRGAAVVAFNAAVMGAGRSGLVPAPVCQPANDTHPVSPSEYPPTIA